ncbi:MAG TPA: HD domain-containing protein [Candidatus Pacearchaeota archaeon]|nr:HD domain-containing protein [Candidatus Pacearchaeota archaeon]
MNFEQFSQEELDNLYSTISGGWNNRFAHVSRVYFLCKKFIKEYSLADKKILLTAALLHDIGHIQEGNHALNGAMMVKELLNKKNLNSEEIEKISECIKTHSIKSSNEPLSIEGKILSDCDRIDVISLDNWLSIIDSKIVKGKNIEEAIKECEEWEKEWFDLGVKFYTDFGLEEFNRIQEEKKQIISHIKEKSLKIIRRGILIYLFDKDLKRIFLVRRKKEDEWGVIAGTSEENEEFVVTALRELEEEVNVKRFILELFPSQINFSINSKVNSLDVLYGYCTKQKEEDVIQVNFPEEIAEISSCVLEKLPERMIPTDISYNLKNFIQNGQGD